MIKSKCILICTCLFFFFAIGCEKSTESDMGNVSFGVNTHLINCISVAEVFIDNKSQGLIPGFCDTIINCDSVNTLNLKIAVGKHSYYIELKEQSSSCYNEQSGDFELKDNECVKIFFDLKKSE